MASETADRIIEKWAEWMDGASTTETANNALRRIIDAELRAEREAASGMVEALKRASAFINHGTHEGLGAYLDFMDVAIAAYEQARSGKGGG